ncbi:TraB/GumN family protein [Candidatus Woesearchaeota archaeon]|nr:TraB/GumN family protein [Candidatus Woesearchaeota archaeon]
MKYSNLTIIGTSHIAAQSLKEVEEAFNRENPDIVAVELDRARLHALMSSRKEKPGLSIIRKIGVKGYLFSVIGAWAEKKLGQMVGVSPGSEMKRAVMLAKKSGKRVALIDQDIQITLRRFSKSLTWKEKWNFLADIVKAAVFRKKEIGFDLTKVPEKEVIEKMMAKVKDRYPNVYKTLIEERNSVMAKNLAKMLAKEPDKKILAVVGAGHEEEIIRLVEKQEVAGDVKYTFAFG